MYERFFRPTLAACLRGVSILLTLYVWIIFVFYYSLLYIYIYIDTTIQLRECAFNILHNLANWSHNQLALNRITYIEAIVRRRVAPYTCIIILDDIILTQFIFKRKSHTPNSAGVSCITRRYSLEKSPCQNVKNRWRTQIPNTSWSSGSSLTKLLSAKARFSAMCWATTFSAFTASRLS